MHLCDACSLSAHKATFSTTGIVVVVGQKIDWLNSTRTPFADVVAAQTSLQVTTVLLNEMEVGRLE